MYEDPRGPPLRFLPWGPSLLLPVSPSPFLSPSLPQPPSLFHPCLGYLPWKSCTRMYGIVSLYSCSHLLQADLSAAD